jgi:hypothetical protein
MKSPLLACFAALTVAVTAMPRAWADANPDFDDDAKPILRMQPRLLEYVESHFDVKDTGTAKYPGDDDRRPQPPYIFRARPAGSHGAYNLRLLIQPGPPDHILNVVDITRVHVQEPGAISNSQPPQPPQPPQRPAVTSQPPAAPQAPATNPETSAPPAPSAPASNSSEPTSDTPSGPIMGPDNSSGQAPSSSSSTLTPPPDPAPAAN